MIEVKKVEVEEGETTNQTVSTSDNSRKPPKDTTNLQTPKRNSLEVTKSDLTDSKKVSKTSIAQSGSGNQPNSNEQRKKTMRPPRSSSTKIARGKCSVQLSLIEHINEITFTHYANLSTDHLVVILDSVCRSYQVSSDKDLLQIIKPSNPNALGENFELKLILFSI